MESADPAANMTFALLVVFIMRKPAILALEFADPGSVRRRPAPPTLTAAILGAASVRRGTAISLMLEVHASFQAPAILMVTVSAKKILIVVKTAVGLVWGDYAT